MARITIEDIKEDLTQQGWKIISTEYQNLDGELTFECNEGHPVFSSWRKIRGKYICPVCRDNKFKQQQNIKVIPKKKDIIRTLALDQATYVSGYAIYDNNDLIRYGTFETNLEDEIARDNRIKYWLISLLDAWKPDRVILEDIQLQEKGTTARMGVTVYKTLAHLQGILLETLYEQDISYSLAHTAVWRQACGIKGKSRADRKKSAQILIKQWYDVSVTEDEADAICIGHYACLSLKPKPKIINWE